MKKLLVVLCVCALAVSACAGGGSDTTENPDAGPSSTQAIGSDETSTPADDPTTTAAPVGGGSVEIDAPCSFVTDTEMGGILGKAVSGEDVGAGLCIYSPADAGTGGIELLIQDVTDVGCELIFNVGGFDDEEPVEGVGSAAMYKGPENPTQMAVCFDEEVTLLMTMYAEPSDPQAALIAVAEIVEQRLS